MRRSGVRYGGACAGGILCALLLGAAAPVPPSAPASATTAPGAPAPLKHGRVLIVPIKGEINRTQGAFLHRTLSGVKGKYDAVIFQIDTPGGRLDIMAQMAQEIIDLNPTPTIGFVSPWALSAGVGIATATDRIYMLPTSAIGAARPWIPGRDGLPVELPKPIDEKSVSATKVLFRAIAEAKNYPVAIVEGMVDESIEVKKVRYRGKIQYLKTEQVREIEADPIEKDKLRVLTTVSAAGKLITFTGKQAVEHGLARKLVGNLDEVLKEEGLSGAKQVTQAQNWSDKLIAVLTSRQIVSLLILVGFGGIWLELKMPGFGVPGTMAVIALLLVFSSQFLVGNANALEILIFVVGLGLLTIELFVTPGFGILGGAGVACVFLSLILSMQSFTVPRAPWQFEALKLNVLATTGGIIGSFIVLMVAAWLLPTTPLFNRLTLKKELRAEEGFGSGVQDGEALVGEVGVVTTALRPAGKMEIADKTYSVVSDAEFIEPGGSARVIRVDGPRIVVEPVPEEDKPQTPEFQA